MKLRYLICLLFLLMKIGGFAQVHGFLNDCDTRIELKKLRRIDSISNEYELTIKMTNKNTNPVYLADTGFWSIHSHLADSINFLFIDLGYWYISTLQNGYYTSKVELKKLAYDSLLTKAVKIVVKEGKWHVRVGNDYIIRPKVRINKPIDFNTYFMHSTKGYMFLTLEL